MPWICMRQLFFDSSDLEHDWVVRVWACIEYYVLVLAPWKLNAIAHCIDFRKHDHKGTVADIALHRFPIKNYFVANLVPERALAFLASHRHFDR